MFANEEKADGYINLGSAVFDYRVDLNNKTAVINTKINSVDKFLKELKIRPNEVFLMLK